MAAAAILKITKIAMVWPIFTKLVWWCKMDLVTSLTVTKFEFHKSKMAYGRHFENRKIVIGLSLQPGDRFWWNLAWWRILAPYRGSSVKISNFWKSKMAAAAILKTTKIAISPQRFDRLVCWCKMDLLTSPTVKKFQFHKSKMADSCHSKNR